MDKLTGNHGPFLPDNIQRIITVRDNAAETIAGRGAHLLTRLDRLYFEGTITADDEPWRERLFIALQGKNEAVITQAINALQHIIELKPDTVQPLLAWAERLLSAENVIARDRIEPAHWGILMGQIRKAASGKDIVALGEYLRLVSARPHFG
jgi:hypothetical protein